MPDGARARRLRIPGANGYLALGFGLTGILLVAGFGLVWDMQYPAREGVQIASASNPRIVWLSLFALALLLISLFRFDW